MADKVEYFDNVTIGQFVLTGVPTKVYVGGRFLTITDPDDIEDTRFGYGMDEDGEMHTFDYRLVHQLLVGGETVTLDTFNTASEEESGEGSEKDKKGDDKKDDKDDEGGDDKKDDEGGDDEESENPFESIRLTKLAPFIVEAPDEPKPAKSKPINEDHGGYTYGLGDVVRNKNKSCRHYGSVGIIVGLTDLMDDMGQVATYKVTNNGPTYKQGDVLSKTLDQLEQYNG